MILPGKNDVLVTLPTGTGKSVLFQGPALFRSSLTGRLTVVVSPLKALMEDHVSGLHQLGFWNNVECINGDLSNMEVQDIYRRVAGGEVLMVFVAPERFRSRGFVRAIGERIDRDGRLEYLVFDEAHCISQWGSEFRPDYFYGAHCSVRMRSSASEPFPFLLLSATITAQVESDLRQILYRHAV
ncbi:MAG: DEAD/DEAH box helicase [Flavobacteriales bacterium]|nr:DEAD/DEAH box helicase [Flavobacteriales bacterium]